MSRLDDSCRISLRLPIGADAPARSREGLRPLARRLGDECLQKVELVLSELVTNAVRHSGAGGSDAVQVEVSCGDDLVRLAVSDPGPGFDPADHHGPEPGVPGGWGLLLVAEVVDRWWVERNGQTRVVAELFVG